jgi:hypothetical protein
LIFVDNGAAPRISSEIFPASERNAAVTPAPDTVSIATRSGDRIMNIADFSKLELPTVFRVLKAVLERNDTPIDLQRKFLETYSRITGHTAVTPHALPIQPEEVWFVGDLQSRRMVKLAILAALAARPVQARTVLYIRRLAYELGVDEPAIRILEALHQKRIFKVRMLAVRRAFRSLVREAYASEGVKGVLRFFGALVFRTSTIDDKLWDYKRLGLPPGDKLGLLPRFSAHG